MSPLYLLVCGIYLPFQVNLYVPNSKPSNKHSVLYARIAHVSTRASLIFHVRRVILRSSVYSLTIAREKGGNRDAQSQTEKYKRVNRSNNKRKLPTESKPLFFITCKPLLACLAWKILITGSREVNEKGVPLKISFISTLKH